MTDEALDEAWRELNLGLEWLRGHTRVLTVKHVRGEWSLQFYLEEPNGQPPTRATGRLFSDAVHAALDVVLADRAASGHRGGE